MKRCLLFVVAALMLMGCWEQVPPGYVGMVMEASGLTGTPLQPGKHSCWGRDTMIRIETKEIAAKEEMSILCKDDLNFKFDLINKVRLASSDGKSIKELLNRQGANMEGGVLKIDPMYKTYVRPAARSIARDVVSKYDTTEISVNREQITKEINKLLSASLKGTPMLLMAAYTSNFDYPDVITEAVTKKRRKEIEIEEEVARQAMKLLQATNRQAVAEEEKLTRTKEAQAEAAYIAIISKVLTPAYLDRLRIRVDQKTVEARRKLYERAGAGDKIIVAEQGSVIPMVGK